MNVLVDGFPLENTYQKGIRRYLVELLRRVDVPFSIFLEEPPAGALPDDWRVVGPLGPSPASKLDLANRWKYRERAKKWRKEIQSHSIFHTSYFRQCPIPGIPSVVVVHDMVCEVMPHLFQLDPTKEILYKKAAIDNAAAVIVISETTKKDFLRFYPEHSNKVHVVLHGADHFKKNTNKIKTCNALDKINPYLLFVGIRNGYKNFLSLMDAMLESSWPNDMLLKVVGPDFSVAESAALKYRNLDNSVLHCGEVSDAILDNLYAEAACFVFPSLFEGFGFPILEAQAKGAAVVANDMAIFHEVAGDSFLPCDCRNPTALARAVSKAMEPSMRKQLIEAGKNNVKRFTWAETVRKTHEIWSACSKMNKNYHH